MEHFAAGLATGIALMFIRYVPAWAYQKPAVLRYLQRDGAAVLQWIGWLMLAACAGDLLAGPSIQGFAVIGMASGLFLVTIPGFLRTALSVAEEIRRDEANARRHERARHKATFKNYTPLRLRRLR